MKQYEITNTTSGVVLGVYEGETKDDALDAMARDAGYPQYCDLPYDVLCDDLIVTEIDETTWYANYRIEMDGRVFEVMLDDEGRAYTEAEWTAEEAADFERSDGGKWTFQGRPFEGIVEPMEATR